MEYKFFDLIDIRQIQKLMDNFCKIVDVASAIIDLKGDVLISSRWQRICTDFHRVNVQTCKKCIESDTILANQLLKGKKYVVYQCKNGLIDAAAPIVVKGEHIANMFIGQFLYEQTDIEFFRKQALQYGFNETSYLEALSQVPIIPKEKIKPILFYFSNFAELLGEMGLKQVNQLEAHKELKANETKLRESEERLSQIIKGSSVPTFVINKSHVVTHWNKACENLTGITASEMTGTNKQWTAFYSKKRPVMADIIIDKATGKAVNGYYHEKYQKSVLIDGAYQAEDFFPHLGKDNKWLFFTAAPLKNRKGEIIGAIEILQDITERKQAEEKLQKTINTTIDTMSNIIEAKDPYTFGHQHRVCQLAVPLAQEMKLPQDKIEGIRIASLIHDIGKIGLPIEILSKPTKLSDMEFDLIKGHSQIGYDILKSIEFPWPIAQIVLQHHEKVNGSGYPRGLKGDGILLEAKIICVADVVEAMSSHRPYRPALGIDKALEEISQNKGILYDPEVVDTCIRLFKEKEFKFE